MLFWIKAEHNESEQFFDKRQFQSFGLYLWNPAKVEVEVSGERTEFIRGDEKRQVCLRKREETKGYSKIQIKEEPKEKF